VPRIACRALLSGFGARNKFIAIDRSSVEGRFAESGARFTVDL